MLSCKGYLSLFVGCESIGVLHEGDNLCIFFESAACDALCGWTYEMGIDGFVICVRGVRKKFEYSLPKILMLRG